MQVKEEMPSVSVIFTGAAEIHAALAPQGCPIPQGT